MTYFILPQIEYDIRPSNLKLICKEENKIEIKVTSLKKYLNKIKGLIDKHILQWDNSKKYTNPYEFIHTNIPNTKNSICKIKPISRAFFKLIEIYNTHRLLPQGDIPINTFHLAEGPGGFIEALCNIRNNPNDVYHGITLMDSHTDVPKWKKAENFMNKHKNIKLVYGPKNDGNLYLKHNLNFIRQNYYKSMGLFYKCNG